MLDCGGSDEPLTKEMIEKLDFISPNETELARLMADLDLKSVEDLLEINPALHIVLKQGKSGCTLISKELKL